MSDLVGLAIAHLADAATTEEQRSAVETARSAFNCEHSTSAFGPHSLADVIAAGSKALGIVANGAATVGDGVAASGGGGGGSDDIAKDPLFQRYLATVKSRGIFDAATEGTPEYQALYDRVVSKFRERMSTKSAAPPPAPAVTPPAAAADEAAALAAATAKKDAGNAALAAGDTAGAVARYTEAIELSPRGPATHIFYANRAAAHTKRKDYAAAVSDCRSAIERDPSYAKAHVRLGTALTYLGKHGEAVEAYERALEIDPSNAAARDHLREARARLAAASAPTSAAAGGGGGAAAAAPGAGGSAAAGANPLAGLAGLAGLGGGGGGMPDLSSLMSNPAIMGMAQNLMQNPEMMQNMMSMMGGGGGGGGGMPDLSALAGMMGGGGPGAGAAAAASGPIIEEEADSDAPAADSGPGPAGSGGAASPFEALNSPELAAYRSDPRLAGFFADLDAKGPSGALAHMGEPAVMEMMQAMMGKLGGSGGGGGGST